MLATISWLSGLPIGIMSAHLPTVIESGFDLFTDIRPIES